MNATLHTACPLIGRILLSAIFLLSGGQKIVSWSETAERMEQQGMPAVPLLLVGAICCELGGGLSVLLGCWARLGAAALIVFLIPTTLLFHDFWNFEGQQQQTQMINFMKNLAILGGLFVLLGLGPGRAALAVIGERKPGKRKPAAPAA